MGNLYVTLESHDYITEKLLVISIIQIPLYFETKSSVYSGGLNTEHVQDSNGLNILLWASYSLWRHLNMARQNMGKCIFAGAHLCNVAQAYPSR